MCARRDRPNLGPLAAVLVVVLWGVATGCGGRHAAALERGDRFAQAGMWPEAAAQYELAARLEPDEPEAAIKLREVQRQQAAAWIDRARAHERRGEWAQALGLALQAAKLVPQSPAVQQELGRMTDAAVDQAERLRAGGHLRAALQLATEVVASWPYHVRARQLRQQLGLELAERAREQARAFLASGRPGAALVALSACLAVRPDWQSARRDFATTLARLRQELRFGVVLTPFEGEGRSAVLAAEIDAAMLRQLFAERLLVVVVADRAQAPSRGIALRGALEGYRFEQSRRPEGRSCEVVCGREHQPNPERDHIETDLARIEERLSREEDEVADRHDELARCEAELDRVEADIERRQREVDEARERLERCRARAKPDERPRCSAEQSALRSARSWLESERRRRSSPKSRLTSARRALGSAREDRDRVRRDRDRLRQGLLSTPRTIEVERTCPYDYAVEVHEARARVTARFALELLGEEPTPVRERRREYRTAQQDETHRAQPGRCVELAQADPLELASEAELQNELRLQIAAALRAEVLRAYQGYGRALLTKGRGHQAAGRPDEATESYIRYLLLMPDDAEARAAIAAFLAQAWSQAELGPLWRAVSPAPARPTAARR